MLSRLGESKPHFRSPYRIYFWEAPLRGARLFVAAARLLPVCRSAPSTCVSPCDIHTFSQFLGFCCDIRRDRSDLARSSVSNVGQAAGSGAEQRKVVPNSQLAEIFIKFSLEGSPLSSIKSARSLFTTFQITPPKVTLYG